MVQCIPPLPAMRLTASQIRLSSRLVDHCTIEMFYYYIALYCFRVIHWLDLSLCSVRVQALVQPLKFLGSTRRVWCWVLVSWLLAAIVAIPNSAVFVQTEQRLGLSNSTRDIIIYKCESAGYTAEWQRKLNITLMGLSFVIIPSCIMIYCYANIIRVVWLRAGPETARNIEPRLHFVSSRRRAAATDPAVRLAEVGSPVRRANPNVRQCHSLPPNSRLAITTSRNVTLTKKRSVVRMAMSVTVGFMVCITPYFVVGSVRIYSDYQYKWSAAKSVSLLMALCHSFVNPFLYITFSTRAIRACFVHLCQRTKPHCCRRQ